MQESVPVRSNWRSTLFSLIAMGILDDAIRQHLDLKRQHGAAESELKQLEDEAFGPPSRPGEPDFPEPEGAVEHSGNGNGNGLAPEGGDSGDELAAPGEGSPPAEAPVAEHPIVDESPEVADSEAGAETPGSEEPTTFYDHTPDDERPQAEGPDDEPSEAAAETPVESLDTVEHPTPFDVVEPEAVPSPDDEHLDERDEELGEDEESEGDALLEEEQEDEEPEEEQEDEEPEEELEDEDSDDVLADTPEFLKDAPEDDELWFEQGKPKDFDF